MPIPLEEQIAAVQRVLAKRHKLYPEFREDSALEIARMEAALATLKALQGQSGSLFSPPDEGLIMEALDR